MTLGTDDYPTLSVKLGIRDFGRSIRQIQAELIAQATKVHEYQNLLLQIKGGADRRQFQELSPSWEFAYKRTEQLGESQKALIDGLKGLLYSTAFPFMESSYVVELYQSLEDSQRISYLKKAKTHVKKVKSLIKEAIDFIHNQPELLAEWYLDLRYAFEGANGVALLVSKYDRSLGELEPHKLTRFNERQRLNYLVLIKQPEEKSEMVKKDSDKIVVSGGTGVSIKIVSGNENISAVNSPGASLGNGSNVSNMQINVNLALSELCELLGRDSSVNSAIVQAVKSEQENLESNDQATRKSALERIWEAVKTISDGLKDSDSIIESMTKLSKAAGFVLGVLGFKPL